MGAHEQTLGHCPRMPPSTGSFLLGEQMGMGRPPSLSQTRGTPPHGVTGQQAGAPGFTFAPRLVLIRKMLRTCACHQLHIGGTIHLGSRGNTGKAGGSEPVPHYQPHQHRTQVLLSPRTRSHSPQWEKSQGLNPWESLRKEERSLLRLGNLGRARASR